jgi:DNA-binding PadR family transcriptional regulator
MSTTRLLVLGVMRLFQPVHGYDVRRELLSWRADQWANVAPGSVYGAIKSLERDGLIEVVGTETAGARPARTTYKVTPEGDKEFKSLLREAWWNLVLPQDPFIAGLNFLTEVNREEAAAALDSRVAQIEAHRSMDAHRVKNLGGDPSKGGTPEHVIEHFRLIDGYLAAQAEWARALQRRLEEGEYDLLDE